MHKIVEFQAVVLAGGRGSRLPDVGGSVCKCLLPVGPYPVLWYSLNMLEKTGFQETMIVVLDEDKSNILSALERCPLKIKYDLVVIPSEEDWGTAESLKHISNRVFTDLVVVSGDLITDANVTDLLNLYRKHDAAIATLFFDKGPEEWVELPGLKSKVKPDRDLVCIDKETQRLVFVASASDFEEQVTLPRMVIKKFDSISMYSRLLDAHLYVMKHWVLNYLVEADKYTSVKGELLPYIVKKQLSKPKDLANKQGTSETNVAVTKDVFDYAVEKGYERQIRLASSYNDRKNGNKGVYCNDLIRCYTHIPDQKTFGIRVNTLSTFCLANQKILSNWQQLTGGPLTERLHPGSEVRTRQICELSTVGDKSVVSEKTSIKQTFIGSNCTVENRVRLTNCVLMNNVTVKEGCVLHECVVYTGASVEADCSLQYCLVGPHHTVPRGTASHHQLLAETTDNLITLGCVLHECVVYTGASVEADCSLQYCLVGPHHTVPRGTASHHQLLAETTDNLITLGVGSMLRLHLTDCRLRVMLWCILLGLQPTFAGILDPFTWARSDRIEVNIPWLPFENETRCYDELGCLNITRSWYHLIHRPFNVFPLPRVVINTRFILYTKKNPTDGQILNANANKTIVKSNFSSRRLTKIIIHGFIDTPLSNWVSEMKDELVKAGDFNVVIVDWAGGSLPLYTQATANTRLVGLEVAHFINTLQKDHGLNPLDVHIIGHSLGAHTAGYAGERIQGLGRITGLDPAEPYFQGMPTQVRLDPSDAHFVDVIHTDGKSIFLLDFVFMAGYGMSQPVGHLDFYPNNGKEQPGCDLTEGPLVPLTLVKQGLEEASRVLVACNHVRAIKLFTESINGKCPYIGHQCPSYQHFLAGKCFNCGHGCAIMGFHADSSPGLITDKTNNSENEVYPSEEQETSIGAKYYLATAKENPYCQRHYRIAIQLANPKGAESWVQGFLKVSLLSDRGIIRGMDLTPANYVKLEHGTTYTIVVTHPMDLGGKVRKVELAWEYDMNVLEPRSLCILWCNDRLYVRSVHVDQMELPTRGKRNVDFSSKLCTPKREFAEIPNRGSASFYDNCGR